MVYKNGDKYEGDWEEDLRSGLGIYYSYVNGLYKIRYSGEWRSDRPHGRGVLYTDKGEPYEGDFVDGLRHGQGRQVYGGRPLDGFGGDTYEGEWFEDKRQGRGTLTLGNGDIYEGLWQNDLKHGEGTYYYIGRNKRYASPAVAPARPWLAARMIENIAGTTVCGWKGRQSAGATRRSSSHFRGSRASSQCWSLSTHVRSWRTQNA